MTSNRKKSVSNRLGQKLEEIFFGDKLKDKVGNKLGDTIRR